MNINIKNCMTILIKVEDFTLEITLELYRESIREWDNEESNIDDLQQNDLVQNLKIKVILNEDRGVFTLIANTPIDEFEDGEIREDQRGIV